MKKWIVIALAALLLAGCGAPKAAESAPEPEEDEGEETLSAEGETADAYIEALAAQIGRNYSVRVATSDGLVQLASLRSGVLRMSARELRESVETASGEIRDLLVKLNQSDNRKFNEKKRCPNA